MLCSSSRNTNQKLETLTSLYSSGDSKCIEMPLCSILAQSLSAPSYTNLVADLRKVETALNAVNHLDLDGLQTDLASVTTRVDDIHRNVSAFKSLCNSSRSASPDNTPCLRSSTAHQRQSSKFVHRSTTPTLWRPRMARFLAEEEEHQTPPDKLYLMAVKYAQNYAYVSEWRCYTSES